jgi:hypothetical protein
VAALDITAVGSPAWIAGTSAATVAPVHPSGIQSGDRLILIIHSKQTTAAGSTIATPSGWTLIDQRQVGSTAAPGNGAGSTRIAIFSKTAAGTEGGTTHATINVLNGNSSAACIQAWRAAGTGVTWSETYAGNANRTSAIANWGGNHNVAGLVWQAKDVGVITVSVADDTATPVGYTGLDGSPAVVFASGSKLPATDYSNTTGNDISGSAGYAVVTSSTGSTGPSIFNSGDSLATAETSGSILIRLRADGTPAPKTGSATGTWTFAGAATGYKLPKGSATGTFNFTGAAVGDAPASGVAYSDDFNRADGGLGANWNVHSTGPPTILSNEVVGGNASPVVQQWATPVNTGDQFSEFRIRGAIHCGVAVAMPQILTNADNTAATYYTLRQSTSGGPLRFFQKNATLASSTELANTGVSPAIGDIVRLEYDAGVLEAFVNGVSAGTHTPGSPITGQFYVGTQMATTTLNGLSAWDDWAGGDLSAPSGPPDGSATGTLTFTGAATGYKSPVGSATGTATFTGAATGQRTPKASATGTFTFTGAAVGDTPPHDGTTTGTFTFTGASTGYKLPKGSATGTLAYVGAAVGDVPPNDGIATGTFTFTGAGAGTRTPKASSTGTWSFTGAGVGSKPSKGSTTGQFTFAGAATGYKLPKGSSTGSLVYVGTTSAKTEHRGVGVGTFTFTGVAVSAAPKSGTGSGTWTFANTQAVGRRIAKASSTGTFQFIGSAAGDVPANSGQASGVWTFTGAAAGRKTQQGSASGSFSYAGAAVGDALPNRGTATGSWGYSGVAIGKRTPKASVTGTWTFTGAATGKEPAGGSATGSWSFTGAATGKKPSRGSVTGQFTFAAAATGFVAKRGAATGTWTYNSHAAGSNGAGGIASASWSFSGAAVGYKVPKGSLTGTWVYVSTTSAITIRRGTSTGLYTYTGASTGKKFPVGAVAGTWTYTGFARGGTAKDRRVRLGGTMVRVNRQVVMS